jgi:acyl-coenzyme A thioesterase PaaI-like protein
VLTRFPIYPGCPVCGDPAVNPASLAVRWEWDNVRRLVLGSFTPGNRHAGYAGRMHGGLLATLLDECLAWACAVDMRSYCTTGDLRVRFKRSAHLDERLEISGSVDGQRWGRYIKARGEVRSASGDMVATASASFAALPREEALAMRKVLCFQPGDLDILG